MDFNQQMHVVGFASKLDQSATPSGQNVRKDVSQILQHRRCDAFAPVFRHKHHVQAKGVHRVIGCRIFHK